MPCFVAPVARLHPGLDDAPVTRQVLPVIVGLAVAAIAMTLLISGHHTPNRDGVLNGELSVCCSAVGSTPEAGTIVARTADGSGRTIDVRPSGRFSVSLPPGRYRVLGGIPKLGWSVGRCLPDSPTRNAPRTPMEDIRIGETTSVSVICQGQ